MIFSIICEETGLVGASLVILVFALLIWRLMVNAVHAPDLLGELICTGIMGHLAIQVILNIAVVTNTIPNTGITPSVRQLRRYLRAVSDGGNGAGAVGEPQRRGERENSLYKGGRPGRKSHISSARID